MQNKIPLSCCNSRRDGYQCIHIHTKFGNKYMENALENENAKICVWEHVKCKNNGLKEPVWEHIWA